MLPKCMLLLIPCSVSFLLCSRTVLAVWPSHSSIPTGPLSPTSLLHTGGFPLTAMVSKKGPSVLLAGWMVGLTFQSKVLLYKNKGFLEKYKDIIKQAYTKDAEKRTRELLRLSSAIREAAVLDEETQLFMDAFDGFDSDSED